MYLVFFEFVLKIVVFDWYLIKRGFYDGGCYICNYFGNYICIEESGVNRNYWWINYNVLYFMWFDFIEIGKGYNFKVRLWRYCKNWWC